MVATSWQVRKSLNYGFLRYRRRPKIRATPASFRALPHKHTPPSSRSITRLLRSRPYRPSWKIVEGTAVSGWCLSFDRLVAVVSRGWYRRDSCNFWYTSVLFYTRKWDEQILYSLWWGRKWLIDASLGAYFFVFDNINMVEERGIEYIGKIFSNW